MEVKKGVQSATNILLILFALLAVLFVVPTSADAPVPTSTPTPAPTSTPTPVPEFTIIVLPVALVLILVLLFFLKMQRRVEK